jgi:predicted glycogen debranching enzyme
MNVTREVCGDYAVSSTREWLVTNGIGGYAAGTIADAPTRRYHGLLVAALAPPLGRTVLFSKLDAWATYAGDRHDLSTTRWLDGTLAPRGYTNVERFALDGTTPVWTYHFADVILERRLWMDRGHNAVYVCFTLLAASRSVELATEVFAVDRDYHAVMRAFDVTGVTAVQNRRARVRLADGTPWYVHVEGGEIAPLNEWYYGVSLAREHERGLEESEDAYRALHVHAALSAGQRLTIFATTQADALPDALASQRALAAHEAMLLERWRTRAATAPAQRPGTAQLVLAADQFIVDRATIDDPAGKTVIAGYPWFGDWGRDTMIALPGLTLATGRPEIARSILRTFSQYVDAGMLPNRFPDYGEKPEYNTVDATLWYVVAIDAYVRETADQTLVTELFPTLVSIVDWHLRGTRFGIAVDPADGLLRSGEAGVQLTWMDAKVGDWIVTPRTGKAVEINALWYNALRMIARLARTIDVDPQPYDRLADRVRASYVRFWNTERAYLYDVIDTPHGNDPAIRPNAIFAVSLPHRLLDETRERAVVERAVTSLLTAYGLRTLAPDEPGYAPTYEGGPRERDASYHCGTVWPWLAGPLIEAHFRVFGDAAAVETMLAPFNALQRACALGTLPEIADAAAPFHPRGCFAQAWSVAEILRVAGAFDTNRLKTRDLGTERAS